MPRKSKTICGPQEKMNSPLASRLRELCTDVSALRERLDVTPQAVNQYLLGQARPSLDKLEQIADFYSVTTDYLLGRTNAPSTEPDIRAACDCTGLSAEAVNSLRKSDEFVCALLSNLIESGTINDAGLSAKVCVSLALENQHYEAVVLPKLPNTPDFESKAFSDTFTEDEIKVEETRTKIRDRQSHIKDTYYSRLYFLERHIAQSVEKFIETEAAKRGKYQEDE